MSIIVLTNGLHIEAVAPPNVVGEALLEGDFIGLVVDPDDTSEEESVYINPAVVAAVFPTSMRDELRASLGSGL